MLQRLVPQLAGVERVLLQDHTIPPLHLSLLLLPLLMCHLLPCRHWLIPCYYAGLRLYAPGLSHVQLLLSRWSHTHWAAWWTRQTGRLRSLPPGMVKQYSECVERQVRGILLELDGRMS